MLKGDAMPTQHFIETLEITAEFFVVWKPGTENRIERLHSISLCQ